MFISTQPPQVKPCQDPWWIVSSSVGTLPTAAPLAVAGTGPFLNDKLLMFSSAILQFFVSRTEGGFSKSQMASILQQKLQLNDD